MFIQVCPGTKQIVYINMYTSKALSETPYSHTMRRRSSLLYLFLLIVLIVWKCSYYNPSVSQVTMTIPSQTLLISQMESFCTEVEREIERESLNLSKSDAKLLSTQEIRVNFTQSDRRQSKEIPYFYSLWRSSPKLRRRLAPCDHRLFMELLSVFDQFCRRYSIKYFMSDGTLLGKCDNTARSKTNHIL